MVEGAHIIWKRPNTLFCKNKLDTRIFPKICVHLYMKGYDSTDFTYATNKKYRYQLGYKGYA